MAETIRSERIHSLKTHFEQATTFDQKVSDLRELLGIRKLGKPTRRWCLGQLYLLGAEAQVYDIIERSLRQKALDELHEKNEQVAKKIEERKLARKEKPKSKAPAVAQTPVASGATPWD